MGFDGRFSDRLRSGKYTLVTIASNENHGVGSTHFRPNAYGPCGPTGLASLNFTVLKLRQDSLSNAKEKAELPSRNLLLGPTVTVRLSTRRVSRSFALAILGF